MSDFSYSVVIRSVNNNDFLRKNLNAIMTQDVLPNEIIIVIPFDVDVWETSISIVRFVKSVRGMVTQRAAGIIAAMNKYILLLDDDVVLSNNTASLLLNCIRMHNAACALPYWDEGWPRKKFIRAYMAFWGIAISQESGGIRYTSGGGYYYPRTEPTIPLKTEGGSGAVIMVDREFCMQQGCFGEEALQAVSVYALRDDGAFILDISQKGGLCLMVGGIYFDHLGGTTRLDPSRLEMSYKAQIFNHYLFWKRYIYPQYSFHITEKLNSKISITRYITGIVLLACVASARSMTFQPIIGICSGFKYLLNNKKNI
ncbi:Glycosyltransferase, GT2 family [Desulfomicrobium norvegicum]|uniref:Glycosyltransferase, GT2 family n=1 Tax=Desulfomicrobium norvegicum (strain DSM 1741 / NCIMB 8310) TaxID=52561 RepID=A0A8G2F4K5_DESNO|nr:glycosyltransferase [Desulfomicrobium norvegicum]SFL76131.1 Glycosyltransferase, GT2 family [Desulfomicrobium norvegicum]